ncbi:xanthine dehydrogenase family protein subunit M [Candidatus Poribacteria bacterium]|nr:xanthine dehydrogenase family protein subunit M [Candidatus Poribacteria bacterium]
MKGMKYFEPKTIAEACVLITEYEEAKIIAGGQSLLPLLKQKLIEPECLINIKEISELNYIEYDEGFGLRIGALTTHRQIEKSRVIESKFSMLSEMTKTLGDVQIRNAGTIGGSLCHADPAADPAVALMSLGASIKKVSSSGSRIIPLDEFFTDYFETALQPGELLTEISIPEPKGRYGGAFEKYSVYERDLAVVNVAVGITLAETNDVVSDVKIALGAVASKPIRAKIAEQQLFSKSADDEAITKVAQAASEESQPVADIYFSENYKRELVSVLTRKTLKRALERAEGLSRKT